MCFLVFFWKQFLIFRVLDFIVQRLEAHETPTLLKILKTQKTGVEMSLSQRLMQFSAVQELEQLRLEKQRLQTETRNLEARSTYGRSGPVCVEWFQEISHISPGLKALSISSVLFSEKDNPAAWHLFLQRLIKSILFLRAMSCPEECSPSKSACKTLD